MVEAADECVALWKSLGPSFVSNIEEDMTETTFAVIARTILAGINELTATPSSAPAVPILIRSPGRWRRRFLMLPETMWHPGKARMRKAAAESRAIVQTPARKAPQVRQRG